MFLSAGFYDLNLGIIDPLIFQSDTNSWLVMVINITWFRALALFPPLVVTCGHFQGIYRIQAKEAIMNYTVFPFFI